MRIKCFCLVLALACVEVANYTLPAKAIAWGLSGVRFSDGGTATGSFDYNAVSNTYSNIDITVGGSLYLYPVRFAPPNSFNFNNINSATAISICATNNSCSDGNPPSLFLMFDSALDNIGGTRNISYGTYGYNQKPHIFGATGQVTTDPIPTPVPFEFSPGLGIVLGFPLFLWSLKQRARLSDKVKH